ncbi:hypothetical protein H4Q26_002698 [Puccinia striiformis f. sp. tritici PST-130]|nr:hypothetical protein H4Q26_002698 [Puccinia striiformis f. sp. tritici PST-130]
MAQIRPAQVQQQHQAMDSDVNGSTAIHQTPTQLSTGAVIAPRSPMPKKKGGEGRGGRGGRPGTGGHEDGRGGRGFGRLAEEAALATLGSPVNVLERSLANSALRAAGAIVVAALRRVASPGRLIDKAPLNQPEMATADASVFPVAEVDVPMAGDESMANVLLPRPPSTILVCS